MSIVCGVKSVAYLKSDKYIDVGCTKIDSLHSEIILRYEFLI